MPPIRQIINLMSVRGKINFERRPLAWYVQKIDRGEPYSFARFGDGEWAAMLGQQGANCDGHQYFPKLGERLRQALIHPLGYVYGIQHCALRNKGRAIVRFLKRNHVRLDWTDSDVFHRANIAGELFPLIRQLRTMDVVMVGPAHLRKAEKVLFPYREFIDVPLKDCFLAIEEVTARIRMCMAGRSGTVITFSASMAANVMIHDLFPSLGSVNWLLDCGALWDVYAGVKSRNCFETEGWETIIKKNTDVGV
jgi:hypothetical protein